LDRGEVMLRRTVAVKDGLVEILTHGSDGRSTGDGYLSSPRRTV
jgi:hypothetical protein